MPSFEFVCHSQPPMSIMQQPKAIDNLFKLSHPEAIVNGYKCDECGCGCGSRCKTKLTNARLIQRHANHCFFCECSHSDSVLFPSVISSVNNRVESIFYSCLLFFLLSATSCCCNKGLPVALRGGFGTEVFIFDKKSIHAALASIPAAAVPQNI